MSLLVVDVEDQLLEEFRRYAVNKRGKIHGVLKPEVALALRNHLKEQEMRTSAGGDKE